jgi:hypothetical protein
MAKPATKAMTGNIILCHRRTAGWWNSTGLFSYTRQEAS